MADAHLLACHHAADCDPETQVLPGCLALISPVGFYSAALNDSVSLDMSGCLDCDAYAALERMDYSIDTAIEWLQAGGLQADFCLVFDESADSDNPPQSRQAPDIAVTSRRDLFVSLLEKARQLLTESKTQAQPITKPDYGNLLPAWRQHLRDIYVTTGKAEDRVAWWPYIERTTDCVGCGMCARFCPTGTLKTVIEDGASVSYFTPGDCLDCRICQLFCPKQAIIRSREQVVNPFSPIEVFRSDAGNCTRCGTPVIGWQIDLCYWCEASVKADREIANSLRGMFKKSH
jgi:formate hydrogenlyase subunit 6/NADH:ubiquinone oxidoreductase subunit I